MLPRDRAAAPSARRRQTVNSSHTPSNPSRGQQGVLTIMDAVKRSAEYLARRSVEAARLSAEVLLAHVLGVERLQLYLKFDQPLSSEERDRYRELVRRRGLHEPVAYLVGHKEFYSLDFAVTPDVLIPRPETEHLVEVVLAWCRESGTRAPRILDLGTGSGNIAIVLLHELPGARATGLDVSAPALAVARANAAAHGTADRLALIEGDMEQAEAVPGDAVFDVVVSNPPYIPERAREALMPDVRDYEPGLALFAGPDPLRYYRAVERLAQAHLVAGGLLAVELGEDCRGGVEALLAESGAWEELAVHRDLRGVERVLAARCAAQTRTGSASA